MKFLQKFLVVTAELYLVQISIGVSSQSDANHWSNFEWVESYKETASGHSFSAGLQYVEVTSEWNSYQLTKALMNDIKGFRAKQQESQTDYHEQRKHILEVVSNRFRDHNLARLKHSLASTTIQR